MRFALPERSRTPAAIAAVALMPYATVGMSFQHALWVTGLGHVAIVLALIVAGRHALTAAVQDAPGPVRLGLGLYLAAAAFGASVGLATGNPLRYVVSQTASMALLPLGFVAFAAGAHPTLRRVAAGLGVAGLVALPVELAFAAASHGAPAVSGEALRLTLRNDISFTATAVMALLLCLGWWAETRGGLPAAAAAAAAILVGGSMSRGAWIVSLAGSFVFWSLWRRRRWWALAMPVGLAAVGVAAVLAASSWVAGHARTLIRPCATTMSAAEVEIRRNIAVTGGPIEIAFAVRGACPSPPVLVVEAQDAAGHVTVVTRQTPNPRAPSELQSSVFFLPAGAVRLDFRVWQASGTGDVVVCEARELPGALAGWLRTLDLRIRQTAVALTHPSRDGTVEYRLAEWAAVRKVWAETTVLGLLTGRGLGATVEFSNSSWDERGNRIQVPTASYLHDFYVFLAFKLGLAGVAALAGLLAIVAWTWRSAAAARAAGGAPMLAAAAACWCAYLLWSVASPEILDFHMAPLWGAVVAASAADAARRAEERSYRNSRSQSSSTSSA